MNLKESASIAVQLARVLLTENVENRREKVRRGLGRIATAAMDVRSRLDDEQDPG